MTWFPFAHIVGCMHPLSNKSAKVKLVTPGLLTGAGCTAFPAHLVPSERIQEVVHVACHQSYIFHRTGVCTGSLHERVDEVQEAEQQLLVELAQLRPKVCTGTVHILRHACLSYAQISQGAECQTSRKQERTSLYIIVSQSAQA